MEGLQLRLVVGVGDVHGLGVGCDKARDARVVDGHADFFELGSSQEIGKKFILGPIHHVDVDYVGIAEGEDPVLEIDEDLPDVLGGVYAVSDLEQGLSECEFLRKLRDLLKVKNACRSIGLFREHSLLLKP